MSEKGGDCMDFRKQGLQHIERGCCPGGSREVKNKMYAAVWDGGLLLNEMQGYIKPADPKTYTNSRNRKINRN